MIGQKPNHRRVAALLVGLTLVTAGCTSESEPEPPPPPTYQQPANDTCARAALQEILRQRWQLALPKEGTANPRYDAAPSSWYVTCNFTGVAEDGRYTTKFGFRPRGSVEMTVYRDVAYAVRDYDSEVKSYRKRVPLIDPKGSVTEISGWWDAGTSVKVTTAVDSGPLGWEDKGSTTQGRELLVRHDNLVVRSAVNASGPTADRVEVGKLLDEIASVLLDESVKHLPRTTD